MKRKGYTLIDVFKLVFAVAVVIIHTQLYSGCSNSFIWYFSVLFTRLAVPFFMVASSFFLGIKIREEGFDAFRAYRKALWPKLVLWGTVGIIQYAITWYMESTNIFKTTLSVAQQMLFYPRGAMWFVLALIVSSYILEFFLKNKVSVVVMFIIALGLYVFALLCNTYYFIAENTVIGTIVKQYMRFCITARNGVFLFIYVLIGYIISSNSLMKLGKNTLIIAVLAGYGFLLSESILLHGVTTMDDSSLFIANLVFIPAFLLMLTKFDPVIPHHRDMRNLSGVMYYTHPVFDLLLKLYLGVKYGTGLFVIVLTMTIIVWLFTRKSKNRFIRRILY